MRLRFLEGHQLPDCNYDNKTNGRSERSSQKLNTAVETVNAEKKSVETAKAAVTAVTAAAGRKAQVGHAVPGCTTR